MFNKDKFLASLVENRISTEELSTLLGISKVTLYRKMNGISDFYRAEMETIHKRMPNMDFDSIFFAQDVA